MGDDEGAASAAASADFPWSIVPEPASREKRSGYFTWRDPHLRGLQQPYIAVRGRAPGPAVAVVAGIHGGEYPGILGALRLGRLLDPERMRGSLLILPVANLSSFWERSAFVTPLDGRDLNDAFPGRATGVYSDVLAYRLMQEIVGPADVLIDLHGGDVFETLASHVVCFPTGTPEIDDLSRAMAGAFGAPYALSFRIGGMLGYAALAGKVGLLAEVGGNGLASDEQVFSVYQGLVNALRALGMLGGQIPDTTVTWLQPGALASAPQDGLWRPAVTLEQQVSKGDTLGTLSDLLGNEVALLTADEPGMVLYYMSALAVRRDETLVYFVKDQDRS